MRKKTNAEQSDNYDQKVESAHGTPPVRICVHRLRRLGRLGKTKEAWCQNRERQRPDQEDWSASVSLAIAGSWKPPGKRDACAPVLWIAIAHRDTRLAA